jgi:CO/xanthine dehydrogenase Mo-binding subunit
VAGEELGVDPRTIEIEVWDTDVIPFDSGVAGSRATRVNTTVAFEAARATKQELIKLAARLLDWPEDTLTVAGGQVRRPDIEEAIGWRELLARAGESVTGRANVQETGRSHVTSFAAQVAEVSVDPETGEVKLLRLTTAHDVGQVINPVGHQGQINGAIMQGIGYALMEEVRLDEAGRVSTLSLGDYKMPSMRDVPPLETVLIESEYGAGPYNIKGIGENPCAPVAPAIANAVADAVGVRIRDLPITAEKVYTALKKGP